MGALVMHQLSGTDSRHLSSCHHPFPHQVANQTASDPAGIQQITKHKLAILFVSVYKRNSDDDQTYVLYTGTHLSSREDVPAIQQSNNTCAIVDQDAIHTTLLETALDVYATVLDRDILSRIMSTQNKLNKSIL